MVSLNKNVQWLSGLSKLYELPHDIAISFSMEGKKQTFGHVDYMKFLSLNLPLEDFFLYWKNSIASRNTLPAFKIVILFLICSIEICL